ncbi:N-acetylneuraminate lyase [Clostridium amylolyticum]|uniref:N-acetylneuraminate lyase n=1 Tax=Clostridium amylolyticum TaxID=1121298 RepID=A0A1M6HAB4_9CLOT|nr:N-acetylneuraminate lyase [Clostridium amylolyticum]SHJ19172.1 N-acetylneuraminate lyase [Clostridium amylolyticum]
MNKYNGIIPALITPYTKEGKINEKSLEKLVKLNLDKGVNGFYVGGSTAEAFMLSLEERKYLLDIVSDTAKGQATIINHVGCISTDEAIELAKHAEKVGVDAISAIPPFYYKFSYEEIKNHYLDIVNSVNLPMIIYNFPAFSGVEMTSERVKELMNINSKFIGVKNTSMNLFEMAKMKEISKNIVVLNGHDEVLLGGLSMGANGAVGSTYNFMADKFIKIYKLFNENKIEEAREIQNKANAIIDVLIKANIFPAIKYILEKYEGIECNGCRKPFGDIAPGGKELLDAVLKK